MAEAIRQNQTLSLRISETLRKRLEDIRKLTALRKGESVSTSEIAKQLLESARGDRFETVELLSKPMEAALEIRRKGEAGQMLSRAQWTVLAYYVQQGSEAFSKNPLSRESYIGILKAFDAAHELRAKPSGNDEDYLGNLPTDCQPERKRSDPVPPEMVRKTVAETVRRLSNPATRWTPDLAARNLYVLLDDEKLPGAAALNEALAPYWPVLWRVAARGHYFIHRQPVRDSGRRDMVHRAAIPSVEEYFGPKKTDDAKYRLSFARGTGHDFDVLLSFPGLRGGRSIRIGRVRLLCPACRADISPIRRGFPSHLSCRPSGQWRAWLRGVRTCPPRGVPGKPRGAAQLTSLPTSSSTRRSSPATFEPSASGRACASFRTRIAQSSACRLLCARILSGSGSFGASTALQRTPRRTAAGPPAESRPGGDVIHCLESANPGAAGEEEITMEPAWPTKTREMHNHHMDSTVWNDFKFRDDDIIISTYNKSGTTWMQQIVSQLLFNGRTDIDTQAISFWIERRLPPKDVKLAAVEAQTHRRFVKTHLPVDALVFSPKAKYIYIGRDGRDVLWSLYNHHANATEDMYKALNDSPGRIGPPLEHPPDDVREYWRAWLAKDGYPYWSFWDNVRTWWAIRNLPNILMVHFDVLKRNMPAEIRRIANFLEIPIDETKWDAIVEHCTFDWMREHGEKIVPLGGAVWKGGIKTFMNKGTNGRWRGTLTEAESAEYEAKAVAQLGPEGARWLATGEVAESARV